MRKALKWVGIILGGLIVFVVVVAIGLSIAGVAWLNKTRDIQVENITIPTDDIALSRGEHLVNTACKTCHGADLSGQVVMDDPPVGTVYAANITGLAGTHTDEDLVRAIRHGLDTNGRQLMIMPAESFIYFSEEDLGSVIAYLKTVPRAGDEMPEPQLGPMGRILMGAGALDGQFPASYIDHELPFPEMPEIGANVEYGRYLSRFCSSCHGPELAGSQPANPSSPPAPNITPAGPAGTWSKAEFIQTLRTGVTPNGKGLDPAFMPWPSFAKFDDDELKALWMFLQQVPQ